MKDKIVSLFKNTFIRNVIIIDSCTVEAQDVSMLLSSIITKLYCSESFGIMCTFIVMITIIIPVYALKYPIAIVLPKDEQDAKGIIRLSLLITALISILSLI